MILIFFLCLATGTKALTFNGKDSKASLKLDVVNNGLLSFDLQTRQKEALLFTSYDSPSNYFVVGIKDDKLILAANYSGNQVVVQGMYHYAVATIITQSQRKLRVFNQFLKYFMSHVSFS